MIMIRNMLGFWCDEDGMTSVEYALLLGIVATVAITAWAMFAARVSSSASASQSKIAQ